MLLICARCTDDDSLVTDVHDLESGRGLVAVIDPDVEPFLCIDWDAHDPHAEPTDDAEDSLYRQRGG